jgi:hypothetical protein
MVTVIGLKIKQMSINGLKLIWILLFLKIIKYIYIMRSVRGNNRVSRRSNTRRRVSRKRNSRRRVSRKKNSRRRVSRKRNSRRNSRRRNTKQYGGVDPPTNVEMLEMIERIKSIGPGYEEDSGFPGYVGLLIENIEGIDEMSVEEMEAPMRTIIDDHDSIEKLRNLYNDIAITGITEFNTKLGNGDYIRSFQLGYGLGPSPGRGRPHAGMEIPEWKNLNKIVVPQTRGSQ